jgi:hypothetical protein
LPQPDQVAIVAAPPLRLSAGTHDHLALHSRNRYILESGRLALTGTSAELANELLQRVYMGTDGATAIGDDADAASGADGAAVEEKEPR